MAELLQTNGRQHRSRKRKAREKDVPHKEEFTKNNTSIKKKIVLLILALVAASLNIYHVSTMHENHRHFSHLSSLEREMSFRTEMGLYYSYYKRIIEAPSLTDGLYHIVNDNLMEYPDNINAIERFNIYPELIIGTLYRAYQWGMEQWSLPGMHCWPVDRGPELDSVTSCEGLGEPTYFYLNFVWLCAGITAAVIFLFGYTISNSIVGGMISTLCFFYNHSEATRVQWTPPLRESFAYPFCLAQMLVVTRLLNIFQCKNVIGRCSAGKQSSAVQVWLITLLTWISLAAWQFSQFVFCTQVVIIYLMHITGLTDRRTVYTILRGLMLGHCLAAVSLFGNKFLVCSMLTCLLISVILTIMVFNIEDMVDRGSVIKLILVLIMTFSAAVLMKITMNFTFGMDDAHVFNILRAKLTNFKDFDTLLYTCAPEFDYMAFIDMKKFVKTLLLPAVIVTVITVFYNWCIQWKEKCAKETQRSWNELIQCLDADVVYTYLQLGAFFIMAVLIMRLKLFLTPHLCVATSLLASRKLCSCVRKEIHWGIIALIIGLMSVKGIPNVQYQRNITGEYSNVPMEQLITWINTHTAESAVFAGPMSLMANVVLSTKRPIVNHPHYEDVEARDRTRKVYTVFGRKSPWEVFKTLNDMGVEYVILDHGWCFPKKSLRNGCSILEIWDAVEDEKYGKPICPEFFRGNPQPFERVFSNGLFVVLRISDPNMPQTSYVEYVAPNKYVEYVSGDTVVEYVAPKEYAM